MAKHLDQKDIKVIKGILDGWKGKLTWNGLVDEYTRRTGVPATRQKLSRNIQLANAFKDRKEQLSTGLPNVSTPQTLRQAGQRIERLTAQVNRVTKENERLLEQFRIWQYNAYKHGLSDDQLNDPLPRIDRSM